MRRLPVIVAALTIVLFVFLSLTRAVANWRRYDADFDAHVPRPAYAADGPVVLFDRGHYDVHTADASYQPLARLIAADGFRVADHRGRITKDALASARVLVVPNALGLKGAIAMLAHALRVPGAVDWQPVAFDPDESRTIREWVDAGGGLLLVADHKPSGAAVASLGQVFGVSFSNRYTEDATAANHDAVSDAWTYLVFSRANGLLGDHPITAGRDASEQVDSVITFTGSSLSGPPGAVRLMRLSETARDFPTLNSPDSAGRSVAGRAQGLAFTAGRGRVVVLGEATMLAAYTQHRGQAFSFGLSRRDHDNRQFALNVIRWLGGALP